MGASLEVRAHGPKEVPGILVRPVLRILINPKDRPIDIEDDVLMILVLITGWIAWTAAIGMALHHPAQELDLSSDGEVEWVGERGGLIIAADGIIISADGFHVDWANGERG